MAKCAYCDAKTSTAVCEPCRVQQLEVVKEAGLKRIFAASDIAGIPVASVKEKLYRFNPKAWYIKYKYKLWPDEALDFDWNFLKYLFKEGLVRRKTLVAYATYLSYNTHLPTSFRDYVIKQLKIDFLNMVLRPAFQEKILPVLYYWLVKQGDALRSEVPTGTTAKEWNAYLDCLQDAIREAKEKGKSPLSIGFLLAEHYDNFWFLIL